MTSLSVKSGWQKKTKEVSDSRAGFKGCEPTHTLHCHWQDKQTTPVFNDWHSEENDTFPYAWSLNSKMLILQPWLQIHPQKSTRVSANKVGCRFVQGNTRVDWKQHQIWPNQFGFLGVKKIPKAKWSQTLCRSLLGSSAWTYYQEL